MAAGRCRTVPFSKLGFLLLSLCLSWLTFTAAVAQVDEAGILDMFVQRGLNNYDFGWNSTYPCLRQKVTCDASAHFIRIDISGLNLIGILAPEIGNLSYLQSLLVQNNRINGTIPATIGKMAALKTLDMSNNSFSGSIPSTFSALTLETLNLANNNLSGSIPEALLEFCTSGAFNGNPLLDISPCDAVLAALLASPPPPPPPSPKSGARATAAIICGAVGAALLLLLLCALASWWLCVRQSYLKRMRLLEEGEFDDLGPVVFPSRLRRFSLAEMTAATDRFSPSLRVGEGGSGTVYRGTLQGGVQVAVKRFKPKRRSQGNHDFIAEIDMIYGSSHANLLPLEGFCLERGERLLVFPLMLNGSVADHLKGGPLSPIPLSLRHHIAEGVADGISYMHFDCKPALLHRDIKVDNVLLDSDYRPFVSDFGLAKFFQRERNEGEQKMTALRGTVGYIAPEYHMSGEVSEKTDTYAFGVFLVELVIGVRMADYFEKFTEEDCTVQEWVIGVLQQGRTADAIDSPRDVTPESLHQLEKLLQLSVLCMQELPEDRPNMRECRSVLRGEGIEERWNRWQNQRWYPMQDAARRDVEPFNSPHGEKWSGSVESADDVMIHVSEIYPMDLSGPR